MKCANCGKKMKEGRMYYEDDGILINDLAHEGFCSKKCILETVMTIITHKKLDFNTLTFRCSIYDCIGHMKCDRENNQWVCDQSNCTSTIPFLDDDDLKEKINNGED